MTETRAGVFNYLHRNAESSLYRNGKVLTRRDRDGSDNGSVGVDQEAYSLEVINARKLAGHLTKTCETNGFELLQAPLDDDALDFMDLKQVIGSYYRQCEQLVASATGAQAFAFDHNVRSAVGKTKKTRISGGQQIQGPAKMVHGDYTLVSAPQRLTDLASPPSVNDTLRSVLPDSQSLISNRLVGRALADGGRFSIINVWRSIADEPVQVNPLALCDSQTVAPQDLVTFEIHYHDRIGENYFAKHNPNHQFYFFPQMTRDEPMLLKQWDSHGTLAKTDGEQSDASQPDCPSTFSFHSAFDDLTIPDDAPDRLSIEVRCIVVY